MLIVDGDCDRIWGAAVFDWAQQSSTKPNQSSHAASSDSAFAMKAAQANMAEVELGKLALQKAMSDDVKKFAQMMVDDHSKALDELKGAGWHQEHHAADRDRCRAQEALGPAFETERRRVRPRVHAGHG